MPNNQNQHPLTSKNSFSPAARHQARRFAIQALYKWQLATAPAADIETEFLQYHVRTENIDLDYFKELIHETTKQAADLDAAMQPFLGRPIDKVDPVELAVLRLAAYEILRRPDVPHPVIINEALELTKEFGSIEGHKFVNGVLDRLAKKHRSKQ